MKLSILIPALTSRKNLWTKLLANLHTQSRGLPVEVLTELDNGRLTSGVKRQRLLERSRGDYVAYVDDDDRVYAYYVKKLLEGIDSNPDVVTFDMILTNYEVWSLGLHDDDRWVSGKMSANHLCAWRRDLATKVAWCPDLGFGDDQLWYNPLVNSGLVKTENHIPRRTYVYVYRSSVSLNQRKAYVDSSIKYFGDGLRCFLEGSAILIEVPDAYPVYGTVLVRDNKNNMDRRNLGELNHYYTVILKGT